MPRRIAVVTTSYPSSDDDPSGHFVAAEAALLANNGVEVTVIAPVSPPAGRRPQTRPGGEARVDRGNPEVRWLSAGDCFGWPGALARLRERPDRALGALRFVASARRELRLLGRVDSIVAHFMLPCGWPIAASASAPLEVVGHGSDVRLFAALPAALRRHVAAEWRPDVRFRFVSEELRSLFGRATTPELAERATVAPCAVELGSAPTREAARRRFGIGGSERLAVVVGRLVPKKRPEIALSWALDTGADRVVVVGDGPLLDKLRARFPRAEFTGRRGRADTIAWIAAADLLVSASLHEGAPTTVREARALGVPVLAAPSGDLVDWAARDAGITLARA